MTAKEKTAADAAGPDPSRRKRAIIEELIYGSQATHRYTQDSPVLADVWIRYGEQPGEPQPLLLTPRFGSNSGEVSVALRRQLDEHRAGFPDRGPARIAYNQIYVAATLHFDELVRLVLPMTRWWSWLWRASWRTLYQEDREHPEEDVPLAEIIRGLELTLESSLLAMQASGEFFQDEYMADLPAELPWLMQLLGTLTPMFEAATSSATAGSVSRQLGDFELAERATLLIRREKRVTQSMLRKELGIGTARARRLLESLEQLGVIGPKEGRKARRVMKPDARTMVREQLAAVRLLLGGLSIGEPAETASAWVWLVNRNRKARTAVHRSRLAVKADAAEHLFHIDTGDLAWAIVDSGIDASHPAFFRRPEPGEEDPREMGEAGEVWPRWTRVKATYDFTQIHRLLDPRRLDELTAAFRDTGSDPKAFQRALSEHKVPKSLGLALARPENAQTLRRLQERLRGGGAIDWKQVVPFLRVEHEHEKGYRRPKTAHGTHVAGILGANWEARKLVGICRDIGLYDLRVLEKGSPNDEFTVLAALQFVQWLNSQKDFFAIHGVNLSLSIRQDVANFACGRTPVCDQSEVLVSSGVTVVAAAGNDGYLKYKTERGRSEEITEGYHTVSISDPGNAENVITVGSTHRFQPHTYGVSYFSSRGPTGDGRIKPDLVAPGEKINSTVPQRGERKLDGTSMATAHVSGAAAMLMARYTELIGEPAKIKKALTTTATDLGREQYFQGAGMLDVLRALQSI